MAVPSAAMALRESFGDRKLPDISRKITACGAWRKQKVKDPIICWTPILIFKLDKMPSEWPSTMQSLQDSRSSVYGEHESSDAARK